ncbi:fibroblast growth factor receptor 4-like [Oculina patagonica]
MLLVIGLFLLFVDPAIGCAQVESLHKHPTAPSLSLNTLEFPDEDVLPTGYNITIICISNFSKEDMGDHSNAQPYWIQYYYNGNYDDYLEQCCCKREDSKVCKFFIQNAKESDSGRYECVSSNRMRCTEDTLDLTFKEPSPPRFIIDLPSQLNISAGNKASLSCSSSGVPRPAIAWFMDGRRVPMSFVTGVKGYSTLDFESVNLNDQGEYWCEANSTEGWNRSTTVKLTVLWKPVFRIHPQSMSANLNAGVATVNISCEADGVPRPVISWLRNNSTVTNGTVTQDGGISTLALVFTETMEQFQTYQCVANNSIGSTLSKEARVTISKRTPRLPDILEPAFYLHPKSILASRGDNVKLTCAARGFPRPNITWLKDRVTFTDTSAEMIQSNLNKSSEVNLEILSVSDRHAGYYTCLATTVNAQISSRDAMLSLKDILEPAFYLHPKSILASRGDNVKFTCAARGFPRPNITWLKDGVTFTDTSAEMIQRNLNKSSEVNLHILSVTDKHVGYYACMATTENARISSRDAMLSLKGNVQSTANGTGTTKQVSKAVWVSIGIGVVLLIVIFVLVGIKQKRRLRTQYHINKELFQVQQDFTQLQIENGKETIKQLRNSQSTLIVNAEDDLQCVMYEDEVIDNEKYLQGMAVDRNWEIARERLVITDEKLGGGEFGTVNKGIYLRTDGNKLPVAVKRLKDNMDQQQRLALIKELETLIHVDRHPNIVSLVGACTFEEPLCVIIEFVSDGSLDKLLRISRVQAQKDDATYANIWSRLTERELLRIASDIASGMRHLESKQCIHRDLACRNVLVGNGLVAKVADFGMARDISTDGQYIKTTEGRIPWLWMSMEALRGTNTAKGDVWSFGVVLWEIVTLGELPYKNVKGVVELHDMLQDGVRLQKPPHCSDELYNIMLRCWEKSPDDRPTFGDLHEMLKDILQEKGRTYIDVTFFEDPEIEDYEETKI